MGEWIGFAGVLLGASTSLSFPAWLIARRHREPVWWLCLLGVPLLPAWFLLGATGWRVKSLANIVEPIGLVACSVFLCYVQVLVLDRRFPNSRRTTSVLLAGLLAATVIVYFAVPTLPE